MTYQLAKEQNYKTCRENSVHREIKYQANHRINKKRTQSRYRPPTPFTKEWEWEQHCCYYTE